MRIEASCPHFFVRDLRRSVRFYVDVLGFDEPDLWGEPPSFAMPSRDGFVVMLAESPDFEPSPNGRRDCWDAYFWVDEVDGFYESLLSREVDIVHGPEVRDLYGMKELGIRDPDGYMLVFAEDVVKEDSASTG